VLARATALVLARVTALAQVLVLALMLEETLGLNPGLGRERARRNWA